MARYRGPKCRLCRSKGEKLFLKGKRCFSETCSFTRRPYPPGLSGPNLNLQRRKISDYGRELCEKQKVKAIYGVLEKQFKNYFKKAKNTSGLTGENLLILLERRLDNVIYRTGWAVSRREARQMVNHDHFLVNGKKMNIPSYLIKQHDIIEAKNEPKIYNEFEKPWLKRNGKKVEILKYPTRDEIDIPIDENLIVAFYSK
ncbi:TPA: 30S ribosomal protein S4 [bacterium]|nr:30S ribosomal protein S4 [bacterium]